MSNGPYRTIATPRATTDDPLATKLTTSGTGSQVTRTIVPTAATYHGVLLALRLVEAAHPDRDPDGRRDADRGDDAEQRDGRPTPPGGRQQATREQQRRPAEEQQESWDPADPGDQRRQIVKRRSRPIAEGQAGVRSAALRPQRSSWPR
jgi:hypothetical protein